MKIFPKPNPFLLLATGLSLTGAQAATVAFENYTSPTDNDFTNNFRALANPTGFAQTNLGTANDYLNIIQAGTPSTAVYDANGSDPGISYSTVGVGGSLTVSTDLNFSANKGSFGFYFINRNNENSATAYLALLNVNYNDTQTDQFRFSTIANASSDNGNTSAGIPLGNETLVDAGITTNSVTNVSATYTILSATSFRLSMSVGGTERATADFTDTTPLTEVEFGFRSNPNPNQTIQMDNFTVPTAVPEPSIALLGGLGLLGFALLRRRR